MGDNKKLLLIIDIQKAFINETTKHIPNLIEQHLQKNNYDLIVLGKFINNENSNFVKQLDYKECMDSINSEIVLKGIENYPVIERTAYTVYTDKLKRLLENNDIKDIYICGLDTDACVLKTAVDLFEDDYNVKIIENLCNSSGGQN